jgi:hypothetical protein
VDEATLVLEVRIAANGETSRSQVAHCSGDGTAAADAAAGLFTGRGGTSAAPPSSSGVGSTASNVDAPAGSEGRASSGGGGRTQVAVMRGASVGGSGDPTPRIMVMTVADVARAMPKPG